MPAEQHTSSTATRPDLPFAHDGYVVIPRHLIDAMPDGWQAAARALLSQLARRHAGLPGPNAYTVQPCNEVELGQLDEAQLASLGFTVSLGCRRPDHFHCMDDTCDPGRVYVDGDGRELPPSTRVRVPVQDLPPTDPAVRPRLAPPAHDQAVLVERLADAADIANYLGALVAAARESAAKGSVEPHLAVAVNQLAPRLQATLTEWNWLVAVTDGL